MEKKCKKLRFMGKNKKGDRKKENITHKKTGEKALKMHIFGL